MRKQPSFGWVGGILAVAVLAVAVISPQHSARQARQSVSVTAPTEVANQARGATALSSAQGATAPASLDDLAAAFESGPVIRRLAEIRDGVFDVPLTTWAKEHPVSDAQISAAAPTVIVPRGAKIVDVLVQRVRIALENTAGQATMAKLLGIDPEMVEVQLESGLALLEAPGFGEALSSELGRTAGPYSLRVEDVLPALPLKSSFVYGSRSGAAPKQEQWILDHGKKISIAPMQSAQKFWKIAGAVTAVAFAAAGCVGTAGTACAIGLIGGALSIIISAASELSEPDRAFFVTPKSQTFPRGSTVAWTACIDKSVSSSVSDVNRISFGNLDGIQWGSLVTNQTPDATGCARLRIGTSASNTPRTYTIEFKAYRTTTLRATTTAKVTLTS